MDHNLSDFRLRKRFRRPSQLCSNFILILGFFILVCLCNNKNGIEGFLEKVCGEFTSEDMENSEGKFSIDTIFTDPNTKINESAICLYKFIGKKK